MLHEEAFSFSQAWQDWYIFQNHYRDRLQWGDGVFVEIGSNQPTVISNTLFFEKCLGWRGVLFEPQERYHASTRRERHGSTLVPSCVVGRGEANRSYAMRGMWLEEQKSTGEDAAPARRCVDPGEVLPRLLGRGARIDLLSIDIEGMEPRVLRCFPFRRLRVQSVLIETNQADLREADLFFHRQASAKAPRNAAPQQGTPCPLRANLLAGTVSSTMRASLAATTRRARSGGSTTITSVPRRQNGTRPSHTGVTKRHGRTVWRGAHRGCPGLRELTCRSSCATASLILAAAESAKQSRLDRAVFITLLMYSPPRLRE